MKIIKVVLLILLFGLFGFSIFQISKIYNEKKESEEIKEELIELIDIPEIPSQDEDYKVDFAELKKINSDIIGWIIIEGTQINYPIVQGSNNSYYLNHSVEKKWNSLGSIFADYRSSSDFSDYNTFIYGHHTKNGSMFGELYKYMDYDFFLSHPTFYLYTPDEIYEARIFSAYIDDTKSESYNQNFNSLEEYKDYLKLIKEKSNYDTNIIVDANSDKMITLYSCSHDPNRQKDDRYYIHAILKKIS